jgi:hypothetical protein
MELEEGLGYPYRVATRYYDFFMRFSKVLTYDERQEIVGAAKRSGRQRS